jgi:hypothetical protein
MGRKEHSNYSNDYCNLHNYKQETTNTNKQNTDFLSTKRTAKDNQKQPMPYLILGTTRGLRLAANPQAVMRSLPLVFWEDTGVGTSLFWCLQPYFITI